MDYRQILSQETMFWSRMGWCADYGEPDEQGRRKPIYVEKDWSIAEQEHRAFLNAGCRIHTSNIHNGWIDVDVYDFEAVDQALEAFCSLSPHLLYMPRIRLDAPRAWCEANPGELALTESGRKNASAIGGMFSSTVNYDVYNQMRSGGSGKDGFHLNSFFSEKWIHDATIALKKVIAHIESGPYAGQIVGYHLSFGMCGETCQWGGWANPEFWGDFSSAAANAFYNHCIKTYGSAQAAANAFGMDRLTPENVLPSTGERCVSTKNLADYFRANSERAILYSKFVSEQTTDNICHFAKTAKEIAPDKPVGFFYGYMMSRFPTEIGHVCIQKLLDSPHIDFLSAPKSYYRSGAGEPGGSQTMSMSVAHHKLWLEELDNDTHIAAQYQMPANHPANMAETRAILWREVARCLAWNNQNFWWMDLYGGWFCDDEIMAEIARLIEFNQKMRAQERESVSEILLISDETTLFYQTADECLMGERKPGIVNQIWAELRRCGAPVDEYRLSDLRWLDLSRYRMIVFANAFTIPEDIRQIIEAIPADTLCVWNYAAGIRNPGFGIENVHRLTGMSIAECDPNGACSNGYGAATACPPIQILPQEGIEILERYPSGAIRTARRKNHLLVAAPNLMAADFHKLAAAQGCHMYAEAGCTIYADSRFIGVFAGKSAVSGLSFRREGTYRDLLTNRLYSAKEDITLAAGSAMVLIPQP